MISLKWKRLKNRSMNHQSIGVMTHPGFEQNTNQNLIQKCHLRASLITLFNNSSKLIGFQLLFRSECKYL